MPYFRIDDAFPQHRKVLAIPRKDRVPTIGLWTLAGIWCSGQLTDGHLGAHMVEELGSTTKYADLLVNVGLWERTDDGYLIHDFVYWQGASREDVLAKRDAEAERKRKWREAKAARRESDRENESTALDDSSGKESAALPKSTSETGSEHSPVEKAPTTPGKAPTSRNTSVSQRDNHVADNGTTTSVPGVSAKRPLLPSPPLPSPPHPVVPYGDYEDGSPWERSVTEVDAHASNAPLDDPIPGQCLRHAHEIDPPPCKACQRAREHLEHRQAEADRPAPLPPLCGHCDNRWIETDDGAAAHCPRCHPASLALTGAHP